MTTKVVRHVPRRVFPKARQPCLTPWQWNIVLVALRELSRTQPTLRDQTDALRAAIAPLARPREA